MEGKTLFLTTRPELSSFQGMHNKPFPSLVLLLQGQQQVYQLVQTFLSFFQTRNSWGFSALFCREGKETTSYRVSDFNPEVTDQGCQTEIYVEDGCRNRAKSGIKGQIKKSQSYGV